MYTPVTMSFDAPGVAATALLADLSTVLPELYEVRTVDLQPSGGFMHARVDLFLISAKDAPLPPAATAPTTRIAAASGSGGRGTSPDPVVRAILFSAETRAAVVGGRIVRTGDGVSGGTVQAIERDAVVVETLDGRLRRLMVEQPAFRATKQ